MGEEWDSTERLVEDTRIELEKYIDDLFKSSSDFNALQINNNLLIENSTNNPIDENTSSLKVTQGKIDLITNSETNIANLKALTLKNNFAIEKTNSFYMNDAMYYNDNYLDISNNQDYNLVTSSIELNQLNCLRDANVGGELIVDSDRNIKTDLKKLENNLEKIKNITGYRYKRLDLEDKELVHIGVIAQDVEVDYPELVSKKKVKDEDKEIKGVNYNGLCPVLIECVKELNNKVDYLENKNKYLENRLKKIEQLLLKKND